MAQITVTWSAIGSSGHRVYYNDAGDAAWILDTPMGLPPGVLSHTIRGLEEGVIYNVGVSAWDGVNESPIVQVMDNVPPVPDPDPAPDPDPMPEPEPDPTPPAPPLRAKDLEVVAEGSGMYRVFVGGAQVSQHTSERKALKRALNEKLAAGGAVEVWYDHDYLVRVEVK